MLTHLYQCICIKLMWASTSASLSIRLYGSGLKSSGYERLERQDIHSSPHSLYPLLLFQMLTYNWGFHALISDLTLVIFLTLDQFWFLLRERDLAECYGELPLSCLCFPDAIKPASNIKKSSLASTQKGEKKILLFTIFPLIEKRNNCMSSEQYRN